MNRFRQRLAGKRRLLLGAIAAVAMVAVFVSAGCGVTLPAAGDVSNSGAQALIKDGVRIVDVRTVSEFEAGHIPAAENVPLDQLSAEMASWDIAEPIFVYCATGSRSVEAMRILNEAGFKSVYNLQSGIVAWDGDVTTDNAGPVATGVAPSASGLPVMYEFYTDW